MTFPLPLPSWFRKLPNLHPERPTTAIAIKTQVAMFRYELVNSTRKFTIVVEIVSLLKKIYKRDVPFRAVFKVKILVVFFSPYPREMKHIPRNLNQPPFWRLLVSIAEGHFVCACSAESILMWVTAGMRLLYAYANRKMANKFFGDGSILFLFPL